MESASELPRRLSSPLVIAGWMIAVSDAAAALVFAWFNRALEDQAIAWGAGVYSVLVATIGLLIDRMTSNVVGRLFVLGGALTGVGGAAVGYAAYGLQTRPGSLPAAGYAVVAVLLLLPGLGVPLVVCSLLVPTGTVPSPRWRRVMALAVTAMVVFVVATATRPGPIADFDLVRNPLGIGAMAGASEALGGMSLLALSACGLAAVASLFSRIRHAEGIVRQQLKIVALGGAVAVVAVLAAEYVPGLSALHLLALVALPLAVGAAILRFRLWGVDLLINRSVVYAGVTVVLIAVYVAVVLLLGAPFGTGAEVGASLIAAGCVAAAFQPVRAGISGLTERFLFGRRGDPYAVVRDVGTRVRRASSGEALSVLASGLAESLRLPHVRITLAEDPRPVVSVGPSRPGEEIAVPIIHDGVALGHLHATARSARERFTEQERSLLAYAAEQAGALLHSLELATALRASQEKLVAAREAERQRLRHDLHDGVGPSLAAVLLRLRDAQDALLDSPGDVQAALEQASQSTRATIAEVRQIVRDLRPAALDALGLVDAIAAQAERLASDCLTISVQAATPLGAVHPATEVAAYAIAREAITNVVRHADATRCQVRLRRDDGLVLEVHDDGTAWADTPGEGIGLRSMRQRVEELGGTLTILHGAGNGTTVCANFPPDLT